MVQSCWRWCCPKTTGETGLGPLVWWVACAGLLGMSCAQTEVENHPPELAPLPADVRVVVGDAVDMTITATDPDGDEVHGRVTAIEGTTLTLENPEGQVTVRTNGDTSFHKGRQVASLEDVTEGAGIVAFGELQGDGSLDATQVYIQRRPPPEDGPGDLRGGSGGPPPVGPDSAPRPDARRSARQF